MALIVYADPPEGPTVSFHLVCGLADPKPRHYRSATCPPGTSSRITMPWWAARTGRPTRCVRQLKTMILSLSEWSVLVVPVEFQISTRVRTCFEESGSVSVLMCQ